MIHHTLNHAAVAITTLELKGNSSAIKIGEIKRMPANSRGPTANPVNPFLLTIFCTLIVSFFMYVYIRNTNVLFVVIASSRNNC